MKSWLVGTVVVGLVAILVGVVASVVFLGTNEKRPTTSTRPPSPSDAVEFDPTVPPTPALRSFYAQELDWEDCGDNTCTTLTVPLDYAKPQGETIEIAVVKVATSDPDLRIGSLVVNPGGPGGSGISYAEGAEGAFRPELTNYFDVVGFDPRGVGASSAIDCLADDRLDTYVAEDPDPDTVEEGRAFARMAREFGSGCLAKSGDLASHVSTIEAARDMDVLRAALGEGTLDYLGASYGTKLGATYADLFPDRVGRLVLDGALDLTLSPRELALQQAAGFQTALEAYVANCVETTDSCFLGESVEEGLDTIEQLLVSIEEEPLAAGDRQLEIGNAVYGIVTPLYVRDYWYLLSTGLKSALDGDGTTLMLLSDAYTSRDPGGDGYVDNSIEANLAINCLDDPQSITPRQVPREYAAFDEASRTFGRLFAWGMTGCRGFTTRTTEKPREIRAVGAAPILVVGTTRDPATPVQWAEALAEQLESGVLITRDGDGHTAYNSGNECIDRLIEGYLVDGVVPDDGESC